MTFDTVWEACVRQDRKNEALGIIEARKITRDMKANGEISYTGGKEFVAEVRETLGYMAEESQSPRAMGWVDRRGMP